MPKKSAVKRSSKKVTTKAANKSTAKKSSAKTSATKKSPAKQAALKPAGNAGRAGAKNAPNKAAKKAPNKAAKKAAKKVAKKAAKKIAAKHAGGHDLRRAYEHLHRVGTIHQQLERGARSHIDTLSQLAQAALMADDAASAADLLRAAEHLAFGSLALDTEDVHAGEDLLQAAEREFETLSSRADELWQGDDEDVFAELAPVYDEMRRAAELAFNARALHRALEYARGAEALTHVEPPTRTLAEEQGSGKRLRG